MQFTIPDVPVSGNKLLRMHWAVRRKYNASWKWMISFHTIGYKAEMVKRTVKIHQVRARRLDKDNLYSSVKPLVDALKFFVIWDDSPDWIDLTVTQETGKPHRTLVEVI